MSMPFRWYCSRTLVTVSISLSSLWTPILVFFFKCGFLWIFSTWPVTEQALLKYVVIDEYSWWILTATRWVVLCLSLCQAISGNLRKLNENPYHWGRSSITYFNSQIRVLFFVGALFGFSFFFKIICFKTFFNVYLFLREREREREKETKHEWWGEGQREREAQNLKQAPVSELSALSPTQGSNPRAVRSWPELK